ncbi:MAG: GAF domain-containing protein, partial [Clostridia bacterium]|nr:GAF domain-containing protein [Clostridia bacterium]
MTDYHDLNTSLRALVEGVPHKVANLANASALIFERLDKLNWAGFYLIEDGKLVLSAFQGKPACIEIAIGRGVCGSAVAERRTLVVPDVHKFPGHIACDGASNSEIVVPLFKGDEIFGVLDVDSPIFDRFDENDKAGLEEFASILVTALHNKPQFFM